LSNVRKDVEGECQNALSDHELVEGGSFVLAVLGLVALVSPHYSRFCSAFQAQKCFMSVLLLGMNVQQGYNFSASAHFISQTPR
jgi:hypothetical protein